MSEITFSCKNCGWKETLDEEEFDSTVEVKEKFCDSDCDETLQYE